MIRKVQTKTMANLLLQQVGTKKVGVPFGVRILKVILDLYVYVGTLILV